MPKNIVVEDLYNPIDVLKIALKVAGSEVPSAIDDCAEEFRRGVKFRLLDVDLNPNQRANRELVKEWVSPLAKAGFPIRDYDGSVIVDIPKIEKKGL